MGRYYNVPDRAAYGIMGLVKIFDIFRSQPPSTQSSTPAQTETVRKIVDALERIEPNRARYLAAFAYILSRVARADLKVSPEETRAMEQIIVEYGGISEDQAILVVQIARHQNLLFGGTENFLVTREFNKIGTLEEKLALLDCLFRVAAAEDLISTVEDNEIRQIASELGLSHREFIAVRSGYRSQLGVFRKDGAESA